MTRDLHVAVLAGGLSHERDVSLRSGRRVADALRSSGCEVTILDADAHLLPTLAAQRPDVVWPVLHGAIGEDGALRDVLELLGLTYVGARPGACRLAWDKPIAQSIVAAAGIRVPPRSRCRTPPSATSEPSPSWPQPPIGRASRSW